MPGLALPVFELTRAHAQLLLAVTVKGLVPALQHIQPLDRASIWCASFVHTGA